MPARYLICRFTLLVLTSICWASPTVAKVAFNETYSVKDGGTLYLDSDQGSIKVDSHSGTTVKVVVEMRSGTLDDLELEVEQDGNDIRINAERDWSFFGGLNKSPKFIVTVPINFNTELRTGGGSIRVADLNGSVEAYTSGGSIELGEVVGDVKLKTSGGSIRIADVAGDVDAHTSGGSVVASISKQPKDNCRLTTSGGSIKVSLADNVAVDLKASTSGGRVRSEFDVSGTSKKTSIKGEINGGGPELYLKTSGGSISVSKL